jgi:hypothetical protein
MSTTKVSRSSKKVEATKEEVVVAPVVEVKPTVVDGDADVPEDDADDSKKQSVDELLEMQSKLIKDGMQLLSQAKAMNQQIRRAHNSAMRTQSQKKKTRKSQVQSGILKLVPLPAEAEAFLKAVKEEIPENRLMRRTAFSGKIYGYVKAQNLYKPDPSKVSGYDRKVIIPDAKLRTLFNLDADKTLDFSSINVNLAVIYKRAKEAEGGAPAPAPTPAPVAAVTKKGKAAGNSA